MARPIQPIPVSKRFWINAALGALALHVAAILALVIAGQWQTSRESLVQPGGVPILLTLAAVPASSQPTADVADQEQSEPLPVQTQAQTQAQTQTQKMVNPLVKIEPETHLEPEIKLTLAPDPLIEFKAVDIPAEQPEATPPPPVEFNPPTDTPSTVSQPTAQFVEQQDQQQAPQQSASSSNQLAAVPNWHNRLLAHLERHKRYPRRSVQRRHQGVVEIQFTINRLGYVIQKQLVTSSGSALLDRSALTLLERAQPLPIPPAALSDDQLDLTVPIRFFLN